MSPPAGHATDEARLLELMEMIIALARHDFGHRVTVGTGDSVLDGIAIGLNMLAEEIGKQHVLEQDYRARMRKAERLAAVGQLAASVAHEVSQPAAFVMANLEVVASNVEGMKRLVDDLGAALPAGEAGDAARALLGAHDVEGALAETAQLTRENLDGVRRIVTIVKELRGFARPAPSVAEPVSLGDVLRDAVTLTAHQVTYRAKLVQHVDPVPLVLGDRVKLTQVMVNLLVNAAHAIPEGQPDANVVEVSCGRDAEGLFARVRDTGVGIPTDVQARLFEPFFTTKPSDRGMGLGLSIAAEIARLHKGEIRFRSAPGEGSTFELRVPASIGLTVPPAAAQTAPLARRPRVLFIDDERQLLTAYRRLFGKQLALEVACGGREALALLEVDARWDLILCDVMMPDLDGPAVYEWVARSRPELADRFYFCSGGVFTGRGRTFTEAIGPKLLEKPVTRDDVARLLAALERPSRPGPG
jgi:signal transduction histidine kinase